MADCNYVLEGWEWENIFTSSLLEHDLPWSGELSEPESMMKVAGAPLLASLHSSSFLASAVPVNFKDAQLSPKSRLEGEGYVTPMASSAVIVTNTLDGSLDSGSYNHDTPISSLQLLSSETSLIHPPMESLSKKKKRDPRLECPNFRAGRIPCQCPEEDEMEEDIEAVTLVKKRSKVGARCQVPSCGEDISHLKGYHQRHRVCLGCANLPKVMLKDQPHRYCQQCGKFHRLSDFDEGKRSCRRKLERHNKRRRRRPVEEDGQSQDCESQLLAIDIDCSNLHLSPEGAATQNVHTAATSTGQNPGMATARAKLKKEGPSIIEEKNTAPPLLQSSETLPKEIVQRGEVEGMRQNITDPVADDQRGSEDSSGSVQRFDEDIISSNKGKLDEHRLPSVPLGNSDQQSEELLRNKKNLLKSEAPRILISHRRCTDYVSPCPTGRISFKLYDWNPADFPRRLRQQIFEWLANMPVELESYVRSGCIILTFFTTMPQLMWDKVLAEWKGRVQTSILKSGVKLLGTGQLTTRIFEKSLCLKNGKATSGCCKDLYAPVVVDLYPRSLEAGRSTQLYVFGFNFSGGRFLLSFGEQYVECSDWESVESSHFTAHKVGESFNNLEVQKVTVFLPDSEKFGLAYVEAENAHGLSNFMPILVADKFVCLEINTIKLKYVSSAAYDVCVSPNNKDAKALRTELGMDMLTDLGWTLKYMNKHHAVDKVELKEALTRRLQALLRFSLEHRCHAVSQRLVQTALTNFVGLNVYNIRGLDSWNISNTLKDLKSISTFGMSHFQHKMTVKSHVTPRLAAAEADTIQTAHKLSQAEGLQGAKRAIKHLPLMPTVLVEGSDRSRLFPLELPLLEERVPILVDGWRHKACWAWSLTWPRKRLATTGTSILCTSNRRFAQILVATAGLVMVCTGMCFMLQHPHEVTEISMSLRRCLWGSTDLHHV